MLIYISIILSISKIFLFKDLISKYLIIIYLTSLLYIDLINRKSSMSKTIIYETIFELILKIKKLNILIN